MGNLLSLYFLHPFKTRLANKTQRFNPRYELTNPTISPPPPFAFSLLSVILHHLHYTLQPPFTLFSIPLSLCYYPRPHVTLSPLPLLLSLVPLLPCLLFPLLLPPVLMLSCLLFLCYYPLFLCYPVSSSPVTTPCSFVTLSPLTLLLSPVPLLLCLLLPCPPSSHPLLLPLCFFVTLSPFTLSPYTLSCKECLPVPSTGAFTLSKTRPFKHAEHAFLAP